VGKIQFGRDSNATFFLGAKHLEIRENSMFDDSSPKAEFTGIFEKNVDFSTPI
jgi:hypothetical protein